MYEVKNVTQLRKFFKHNAYTWAAQSIILGWLEKVNANFKDENDFNERMPKLIEKYLLSEKENKSQQDLVARAYFGIRGLEVGYRALRNTEKAKKTQQAKETVYTKKAEEPEDAVEPEEPKKRISGTERLYKNGNMEIYKTTIDNDPTIMILLKNYSTDSLLKSLISEMINDFFCFF